MTPRRVMFGLPPGAAGAPPFRPAKAGFPWGRIWAAGPPGTTSIVALHGFTGEGRDFQPLASAASSSLSWVCPDLPGHGPTPVLGPKSFRMSVLARALDRLVEGSSAGKVLLAGYSLGGRLLLQALPRLRTVPSGVVLISAASGLLSPEARRLRRAEDAARAEEVRALGVEEFWERWIDHPVIQARGRMPPADLEVLRQRRGQASAEGWARSLERHGLGGLRPVWPRWDRNHAGGSVPVLLLTGSLDPKFCQEAEVFRRHWPDLDHRRLEGVGHAVHLEAPQACASLLSAFAAALPERFVGGDPGAGGEIQGA